MNQCAITLFYLFKHLRSYSFEIVFVVFVFFIYVENAFTQTERPATEDDYYKIVTLPIPVDIVLEVSGIDLQPNGNLVVVTRYGEVWLIKDPYMEGKSLPQFKRIARGLHTPMGIASKDGRFYVAQRSEITELVDNDGNEIIDQFRTYCTIHMSGNYCEYVHGPIILPDGNFWVNMNLGHNWHALESFFGMMGSHAPWKGWAILITPDGKQIPYASGLRSPAGMGIGSDGTMYYSENEGDWVGTGFVTTINEGDFFGHPSSLKSASLPESNIDLRPEDIPDKEDLMLHQAAKMIPQLRMPSVRLPHGVMGNSLSWILEDTTGGAFGPFEGQLFIADQTQSKIMRVFMEEVNGEKQGAAFQFREGFQSGIIRTSWGIDGSMFVGMTDRGWSALGGDAYGLQRLVWTGKIPFEVKTIHAKPDGFELTFTKPVDQSSAQDIDSFDVESFDYLYRKAYGSPPVDRKSSQIKAAILSEDGLSVRIVLDEMRKGYVYQIAAPGIRSNQGMSVLHPTAYYTLNEIPEGESLDVSAYQADRHNHVEEQTDVAPPENVQASDKHVTQMPNSWTEGPDQSVTIGTAPGLQFDRTRFEVQANSRVRIVFNNTDDMPHNLVITMPNSADQVGEEALALGISAIDMEHIPDTDKVLYHTSVLPPGSSEEIYFTAPSQPGEYEFVCTYPGHYRIMRGTLIVTP